MNTKLKIIAVVFVSLIIGACSSTPTWEGMSQTEIAQWKQAGFDPGTAQSWSKKGFTAADASSWRNGGFDLDKATDWKEEKFTADEAKAWKAGGFNLDEAVEDRAKGLQPVQAEAASGK
ncbi:MAG: hypothetical protein AAGF57_13365 [Pseudomonadota bacterium]